MILKIPLTKGAQRFSIELGGHEYRLSLIYRNAVGGGWFLDMARTDKTGAIYGIPLLLNIDLLEQYQHKGFGHLYARLDGVESEREICFKDMGANLSLLWSDTEF